MKVRGSNGKWLWAGNWRTVGEIGLVVMLKFHTGIGEHGRKGNALIVIDVVELSAQHECVGGKYSSGSRRGSVNRKEGVDGRELVMDFFFLNVEEASNVLDHLFVGEGHFVTSGTVWGRRGNDVGSVASTVGRGRRVRWNEDGGGQARHCWNGWTVVWCVEGEN